MRTLKDEHVWGAMLCCPAEAGQRTVLGQGQGGLGSPEEEKGLPRAVETVELHHLRSHRRGITPSTQTGVT